MEIKKKLYSHISKDVTDYIIMEYLFAKHYKEEFNKSIHEIKKIDDYVQRVHLDKIHLRERSYFIIDYSKELENNIKIKEEHWYLLWKVYYSRFWGDYYYYYYGNKISMIK